MVLYLYHPLFPVSWDANFRLTFFFFLLAGWLQSGPCPALKIRVFQNLRYTQQHKLLLTCDGSINNTAGKSDSLSRGCFQQSCHFCHKTVTVNPG